MDSATTNPDKQYTLLIVDDNEMNRQLMTLQFKRAGYNIVTASNGHKALELIETTAFDLVLLDIVMPGMNGLEVLEEIRKHHSLISLPVIMVTADDLEQSVVTSLQLGANDYLTKPLNIPVALARIKTQLALKDLATLKDEFVRFASHDLKKPLIVMMDIAAEMKSSCQPGEPIPEDFPMLMDLMTRTGDNMQKVIAGFLNTESTSAATPEPKIKSITLNDIVDKSLQANESYARKKGVRLKKELADNLPAIEGDEFRLSQVLDNLIGNAMKFSPRETTTVVRTHADEDYVYAEVCDGGPGLTEDDMKKLFTRYAKLTNRPTGNETSSGIGLSMSKQFVELHEGKIGVKNNPDHGATFWFSIPIKH
ncbi:MAG: HAMP domain-containing sensor histidine kinase [Gammaproteobacteria bacterium]|jgi:two-component system sensor histidine kinase/response regulator